MSRSNEEKQRACPAWRGAQGPRGATAESPLAIRPENGYGKNPSFFFVTVTTPTREKFPVMEELLMRELDRCGIRPERDHA